MKLSATELYDKDETLEALDLAADAALMYLTRLLAVSTPLQIKAAFIHHIHTHLATELANIEGHGHKHDDPADSNLGGALGADPRTVPSINQHPDYERAKNVCPKCHQSNARHYNHDQVITQFDPETARDHAMMIVVEFRKWREARGKKGPPSDRREWVMPPDKP
jgi:hypothetical protein